MSNHIKKATIEDKPTIHTFIQPYLDELSRFPDDILFIEPDISLVVFEMEGE
jgi:hypothetical protein